jgi:branched-chain amino acid transport system permease protein
MTKSLQRPRDKAGWAAALARADARVESRKLAGNKRLLAAASTNGQAAKQVTTSRAGRLAFPTLVFAIGFWALFGLPDHLTYAGSTALAYGLIGLGLYLPLAALRELPLNAAGLAGLGAYLFAYVAADGGFANFQGIAVAILAVVGLSVIGGMASLVVTGLYFAVASLVVQVGLEKVVFSIGDLTGGASGRSVYQPGGIGFLNTQRSIYLVTGLVALTASAAVWKLKKSRTVANWIMTGHQPEGASAAGIRRWAQKLIIFGLSGLIIGIGGCLMAFVNGTPPPIIQFNVVYSVIFLAIPVASGLRDIASLWVVAAVFTALPIILEPYGIDPNLLSGGILATALIASQSRDAISARIKALRQRNVAAIAAESEALSADEAVAVVGEAAVKVREVVLPDTIRPTRALVGEEVSVTFGGIRAVDNVSVRVGPGQRVGIVGANGAGKTTLFNALTGYVPLAHGTVHLGDQDITHMPPYARARAGLGRTFQLPRLADILTVRQNIAVGQGEGMKDVSERSDYLMARLGLTPLADIPIAVVPFGSRRKVEIVRALVRHPQVLMVDEPVSGLEDHEVEELIHVLLDIQADEGWGILLIEHDLRFIKGIAEYLMVMEDGVVLTDGPINDVLADERVRRVYLGEVTSV